MVFGKSGQLILQCLSLPLHLVHRVYRAWPHGGRLRRANVNVRSLTVHLDYCSSPVCHGLLAFVFCNWAVVSFGLQL